MCKPLNLEEDALIGDNATAYRMLKHNGYAPPEIELLKEFAVKTSVLRNS